MAQEMGKVSFSAYLLHFAVLSCISRFPDLFGTKASGAHAIMAFAACWVAGVIGTALIAAIQYRIIEAPMIGFGRSLEGKRRHLAAT
jgi:peptidoglycan/LPS O-acetylase OafA/YrhL